MPFLPLHQVVIDPEVARTLPRKLAYYHLAVPLAIDDGQISLAIAQTDNSSVIEMFSKLLNAAIVPIQADPVEIRAALDKVWQGVKTPDLEILAWGDSPDRSQFAQHTAAGIAATLSARVIDLQGNDLDAVLMASQHDSYTLTVVSAPITPTLLSFVRGAGTPVLLLQGEQNTPNAHLFSRLLLSLRGHSPDLSALDLVIPLARSGQSALTVLAVTGSSPHDRQGTHVNPSLAALLDPQQEPAQHLAECVERLNQAHVQGYLKLCQGDPVQQIVTEFTEGRYSLLAITSEAYGDFIQHVIEALRANTEHCSILIVKPMLPQGTPK